MKYFELMSDIMSEFKANTKVSATIDGKHCMLTESQVRALQVLCSRLAKESEDKYNDFVSKVIIYGGTNEFGAKYHPKYGYSMVFRKDGCFANDFKGNINFYTADANMAFELF